MLRHRFRVTSRNGAGKVKFCTTSLIANYMDQPENGRRSESERPSLRSPIEVDAVGHLSESMGIPTTMAQSATFDAGRALRSSFDASYVKGLQSAVAAMNMLSESPAIAAMRAFQTSPAFSVARQLREAPAMQWMRSLQTSPVFDVARLVKESPAFAVARSLQTSPFWGNLHKLEASPVFAAMRALQRPAAFEALQTIAAMNSRALNGAWHRADLRFTDEALLQGIAAARDSHLEALIQRAEETFRNLDGAPAATVDDEAAVAEEIRGALLDFDNIKTLSLAALGYFFKLIVVLCAVYQGIAQWPDFQAGACDLQARLLTVEARRALRRVTKGLVCDIPHEMLKGMRYTDRASISLHERPAIRAKVLETLPKGAVLIVLDDSDRNWLLVRFSYDGRETDGWVSRKFVRRFLQ